MIVAATVPVHGGYESRQPRSIEFASASLHSSRLAGWTLRQNSPLTTQTVLNTVWCSYVNTYVRLCVCTTRLNLGLSVKNWWFIRLKVVLACPPVRQQPQRASKGKSADDGSLSVLSTRLSLSFATMTTAKAKAQQNKQHEEVRTRLLLFITKSQQLLDYRIYLPEQ